MRSEVAELLAALRDGTLSTDQVAQRFRERSWPRKKWTPPRTYLEIAEAAQWDPDQLVPGSFDEVATAYYRREISIEQYGLLADAAAESMRREDLNEKELDG